MLTAFSLREALAHGQLVVHYQPKLNLRAEPVPAIQASEASGGTSGLQSRVWRLCRRRVGTR